MSRCGTTVTAANEAGATISTPGAVSTFRAASLDGSADGAGGWAPAAGAAFACVRAARFAAGAPFSVEAGGRDTGLGDVTTTVGSDVCADAGAGAMRASVRDNDPAAQHTISRTSICILESLPAIDPSG